MTYFITGAAGFIGSQLTDRLLGERRSGCRLRQSRYRQDALSRTGVGEPEFPLRQRRPARHRSADTRDEGRRVSSFISPPTPTCASGREHPERDLQQNTIATFNVLEAMRANGVKRIGFSSTGSIYGEPEIFPTPEDAPFPLQTSLYGASKAAAEGMIQAYCEGFDYQAYIFRFVSILGERYTHGHVFDFYRKLAADPTRLEVLGNGQAAQVLSLRARLHRRDPAGDPRSEQRVHVLNLGTDEASTRQQLDQMDFRAPRRPARTWRIRAASAAGSATARSSCSTRNAFARLAGSRS